MGIMSAPLLQSLLHSISEASFCEFLARRYGASSRPTRARKLAEFLRSSASPVSGPEAAHPGEYSRSAVLCELLEDAVSHAFERGLPFPEVYRFTRLYAHCLGLLTEQRDAPGSSGGTLPTLTTSIIEFKSMMLKHAKEFSQHSLISIIDYITTTLFQHYHLYQYLLTEEQPSDSTVLRLDVEIADNDPPLPLNTAMSAAQFERREKIKELESMQAEKVMEHAQSREKSLQRENENLTAAYRAELSQLEKTEITQGKLAQIIDSLAQAHVQSVKAAVSQELEKHELEIGFQVQKMETVSPERATPQPQSPRKFTSPLKI